jgi:hypothetical protein
VSFLLLPVHDVFDGVDTGMQHESFVAWLW